MRMGWRWRSSDLCYSLSHKYQKPDRREGRDSNSAAYEGDYATLTALPNGQASDTCQNVEEKLMANRTAVIQTNREPFVSNCSSRTRQKRLRTFGCWQSRAITTASS